ncbi:MAG TPA: ACT domain-containing protein [Polyangiaceae bacterium]|nr:ACT domain-containing protein [Polyangiaceae bacterium]
MNGPPPLRLEVLAEPLAVCRLGPRDPAPAWASSGPLQALVRSEGELSAVCADRAVPPGVRAERGFRALRVAGPLDFALTGVLAAIAAPLAREGVSIFAVSTFDTDYVLVREGDLGRALAALAAAGHDVGPER